MLSLCMIVRDEEKNLPRVLGSVRGLVDEIVVADTGSTDRTVEVAKELEARVESIPWTDDFAAARNHSLSMANGDWILVLDGDDEFEREDIELTRRLLGGTPAMGLTVAQRITYPGAAPVIKSQLAIFRNRPELRYEYRIHEHLNVEPSPLQRTAIRIYHHGYTEDTIPRKQERNRRLLRMMKEDADPLARAAASYYLGNFLENDGRLEAALHEYRQVAYSDAECEYRLYAVLGVARLSTARGQHDYAAALYRTLLQSNPGAAEAELGLAYVLMKQGRPEQARSHFRAAQAAKLRILPCSEEPWEIRMRERVVAGLGAASKFSGSGR